MNVKSLAMKSCQMGNWEACNMYSVLSLEGLFGVKRDTKFGVQLAEKYDKSFSFKFFSKKLKMFFRGCYEGHEIKSCVNLIKIHEANILELHPITGTGSYIRTDKVLKFVGSFKPDPSFSLFFFITEF